MKFKAIVDLLSNRVNQPHVIEKYLRMVGNGAYKKGAEDAVLALPAQLREMANRLNEKTMTVKELITALEQMPEDKIVVLTDGIVWDNVGQVIEDGSTVKIAMDGNHPFED